MFGLLPPSSSVTGIRFSLAYCMISRPVVVSPVKAILRDPRAGGQRLAGLDAEAVDDVEHARRQQVGDQLDEHVDRRRGLLGGLEHDGVARGQRGRELPDRHQDREVPRDDLPDDAERLVEVVGDGVLVDLARCRPPGRGSRRRSSGSGRSASGMSAASVSRIGLPFSQRLGDGERLEVRLDPVGDLVAGCWRARPAEVLPHAGAAPCAASSASSMSSAVPRATSRNVWPVIGVGFSKYWPLAGGTYSPPMKLS